MSNESQLPANESSSSTSDTPKRKRGRPKGSKTQPLEHVVEIPQGCPRCNCSDYKTLATPAKRNIRGIINGVEYNRVVWRRCRCKRCQTIFAMRVYTRVAE